MQVLAYEEFNWGRLLVDCDNRDLGGYLRIGGDSSTTARKGTVENRLSLPLSWLRTAAEKASPHDILDEDLARGWRFHESVKWRIFTLHALSNSAMGGFILGCLKRDRRSTYDALKNLRGYELGIELATVYPALVEEIIREEELFVYPEDRMRYTPNPLVPFMGVKSPLSPEGPSIFPVAWRRDFTRDAYVSLRAFSDRWETAAILEEISSFWNDDGEKLGWSLSMDTRFRYLLAVLADSLEGIRTPMLNGLEPQLRKRYEELCESKGLHIRIRDDATMVSCLGNECGPFNCKMLECLMVLARKRIANESGGIVKYDEIASSKQEAYQVATDIRVPIRKAAQDTGKLASVDQYWPIRNVRHKGYKLDFEPSDILVVKDKL